MKVAWAKAKKKTIELSLEQMRKQHPAVYEATFQQWLSERPSIVNESAEAAVAELQNLVKGLRVLDIDWEADVPVVAFELDVTKPRLKDLSKLSDSVSGAKKDIDALLIAGYPLITYNGKTLYGNKKPISILPKNSKLVKFIRQAFWSIYQSIYENRLIELEDTFLDENEGIMYEL